MNDKQLNRRKNKLALMGLFLIFLAPVLFAWYFLYFSPAEKEHKNLGHLIQPARAFRDIKLQNPYENSQHSLFGKWNLVFLNKGECLEQCLANMYKVRQIRLAMSKHDARVQRVAVIDGFNESNHSEAFTEDYRGQLVLPSADLNEVENQHFMFDDKDPYSLDRIYIIDPIGNLMMFYESDANPMDIIKDLKLLLKSSRIG